MMVLLAFVFTSRASFRRAARIAALVAVAAFVPPMPSSSEEWMVRVAAAIVGSGILIAQPSAAPTKKKLK